MIGRFDRRRGVAMVLVLGQLAFLFAFWSLANRQVGALLTLQATLDERQRCDAGSLAALAAALARLETGTPPEADRLSTGPDTWEYGYPAAGPTHAIRLVQTDDDGEAWDLQARPSTSAAKPLPVDFAPPPGEPEP